MAAGLRNEEREHAQHAFLFLGSWLLVSCTSVEQTSTSVAFCFNRRSADALPALDAFDCLSWKCAISRSHRALQNPASEAVKNLPRTYSTAAS